MRPNRRETISLLVGTAPAALGVLSVAGIANPSHAEAKPKRRAATTGRTGSQKIETRIGTLEFTHDFVNGYPTDATIDKLYDERDFQRACQAYLWSLPAVSFTSWQRGITEQVGARNGQIVVALVNHEATIKTYFKKDSHIELDPANTAMQPIIVRPSDAFHIEGILIGVIRHCTV